ncbi:MAG: putative Ig domain-containing protein, partial [Acidobacteriota bacterium]|nr:putative Ig domain-containing protein [Acidobacteriota bacterium]
MSVIALNHPFQALGEAHVEAFGNTVTIANIGSSGEDGTKIVIDEPGVKAFSVSIAPFDESTIPAGAYLQGSMRGTLNGTPDQVLGRLRDTRSATGYVVTSDFGALTPATRSLRLTNNGVSVLEVPGFNGAVDASSSCKMYKESHSNNTRTSANAASAARTKLSGQTSNTMTLGASYPANTVFKINGTDYVGDQLEFSAVGAVGTAIGDFSDFRLTAADIPEFTILEIQSVPADTPPTISAVAVARQAGSPSASATIANVSDIEDAKNTLIVKVNNATMATVNGVTVSGLNVDSAGAVTANVVAACAATNASFALTVTDSGGTLISTSLDVSVNANAAPLLGYNSPQAVAPGQPLTINPTSGPGDNGSINSITVLSAGGYTGGISVNGTTGVISLTSAAPLGTFTITIRATDQCGATRDASFTLNVGSITSPNGLQFYPLAAPVRLLDTRGNLVSPNACTVNGTQPIAGGTSLLQAARGICTIPATAQAITGNVTTVTSGGGYLTIYPSGAVRPTVASINYNPNEIVNNVFTSGLGADGNFNIYALNTTDTIIDVTGYYAPPAAGGLYFHPLPTPVRLLETRAGLPPPVIGCVQPGTPLPGGADSLQMATTACTGIPAGARAIVGNATTVSPQGGGYLTLYPADAARPLIASSNYDTGQIVNGPFTTGL